VTASGGPNFAYELCGRAAEQAPPDGLDLSRWRVAFNGAEPIRAETLRRFADAFAPAGFPPDAALPCYGPGRGDPHRLGHQSLGGRRPSRGGRRAACGEPSTGTPCNGMSRRHPPADRSSNSPAADAVPPTSAS
jgi:acyl-CoA synthetase (AMP-forming)/AMP-acid ligase II